MKLSFWTKLLSYLGDITLEQRDSDFSGKLELIQRKGRVALCTQNAVYSYEDLYVNFRDSFAQINLDKLAIKKVLVLGLGLGSIPLLLEKKFNKNYHYTLVEIDEIIVDLAQKYTLSKLNSTIDVFCQDALDFVQRTSSQFDLIAVDIFIDDITPSQFESIDFLETLKNKLTPNGLLMYNRLIYNKKLENQTHLFYQKTFSTVFENACVIGLNGNKMLLNYNCLK